MRGIEILRSSLPGIATGHTKIRRLGDAPNTSCLLPWWRYQLKAGLRSLALHERRAAHHDDAPAAASRLTVCRREAILARSDPCGLGRSGTADGSPGLGRGSVARRPARRARTPDAHPSRAADGWPDLAVCAGGGVGLPRAGLATLVGPEGRPVAALTAQPQNRTSRRPALARGHSVRAALRRRGCH